MNRIEVLAGDEANSNLTTEETWAKGKTILVFFESKALT